MVINADPQDGLDAAERARSGYRGEWHPLLAAVEGPVGTWVMTAPDGARYGIIRQLELGGERGYRAVTWAEASHERQLIGYYRTLRAAAMATHRRYLASHGPRQYGSGHGSRQTSQPRQSIASQPAARPPAARQPAARQPPDSRQHSA
jgi:hypothetical protein